LAGELLKDRLLSNVVVPTSKTDAADNTERADPEAMASAL